MLLIPALLAIKLPWMLLQLFAWGLMIESNLHTADSFGDALKITFTPEDHCQICKSIDDVQHTSDSITSPALGQDIFVWLPAVATFQIQNGLKGPTCNLYQGIQAQWISDTRGPPPRSVVLS